MNKEAITQYNIHPILKNRYSPRTFENTPIDKDILNRLFEAFRWSPSSSNEQPWKIIVGIKGNNSGYEKIFSSLVDFNQKWANLAPVLLVIVGIKISAKTGKESNIYKYDCGQAIAHLTFQAMEEGLFVHQMGGFDPEIIRKEFNLIDSEEALTVVALGHKGKLEFLPENFQQMEKSARQRKTQDEFVSWE